MKKAFLVPDIKRSIIPSSFMGWNTCQMDHKTIAYIVIFTPLVLAPPSCSLAALEVILSLTNAARSETRSQSRRISPGPKGQSLPTCSNWHRFMMYLLAPGSILHLYEVVEPPFTLPDTVGPDEPTTDLDQVDIPAQPDA